MRKEAKNDDEQLWSWWQTIRLRMEIRKRMNPITPDQANMRKLITSGLYLLTAAIVFHALAIKAGIADMKEEENDVALRNMNVGKIVTIEDFKITKMTDFRSEDFENKIKRTNKPTTVLE